MSELISLIPPSPNCFANSWNKWYSGSQEYLCAQVLKHHSEPGSHLPQRGSGRKCWRAHPRAFLSSRSGDYQQYSSLTLPIVITDIIFLPLDRRGFRKKRAKCWSWNYWSHPDSLITFLWHPSITMTIFGVTTHCNHCDHCQGPYRHYILNALWILINLLCLVLTLYQVGHNNLITNNQIPLFFCGFSFFLKRGDPLPLCGVFLGGNSWSDFRGTQPLPNKTKLKHDQNFRASALN